MSDTLPSHPFHPYRVVIVGAGRVGAAFAYALHELASVLRGVLDELAG
jgi:2-polyprenyl-6-methoxyphenol hydroxylase-like FAD-dependent oxidoreductase